MIGRRSVLSLALLCAFCISAIETTTASAGPTTFDCLANPSGTLHGPHCLSAGPPALYSHATIAPGKEFGIVVTNENTASETTASAVSVLAGTLSGVETELQCTGVESSGEGAMENTEVGGVMGTHGTATLTYTGCTVLKPAGKSCAVNESMVTTKVLFGEGLSATELKFTPKTGETFAEITIEKCTVTSLNNTFPVTGSVVTTVSGSTVTSTVAGTKAQKTLKFGGQVAGLGGSDTVKTGGTKTPVSLT